MCIIKPRYRRYAWNYFRLENEHLNNVGKFRAVRDISIGPMRQNDLRGPEGVIQFMDETDDEENDEDGDVPLKKNLKLNFNKLKNFIYISN